MREPALPGESGPSFVSETGLHRLDREAHVGGIRLAEMNGPTYEARYRDEVVPGGERTPVGDLDQR